MWKWETEKEAKGIVVIVHNMLEHTGRYAYVITKLRREGYHVIMGDLKGQGQTSRVHRGHVDKFEEYHEQVLEWISIAEEYHLPVFTLGVGLGGLILLNLLEKVDLKVEGVLLISPLVAFQQNISTRRNFLASSFVTVAKDAKFDTGIKVESLTRNKEVIDDTNKDALMLNKVSYHWYKTILETMKATMENIHHISPIPTLLMLGTEDKIVDTESIRQIGKTINTNELYFKAWHGLNHEVHNEPERENVMKYIISFMNNRIHYVGLLIDDETE